MFEIYQIKTKFSKTDLVTYKSQLWLSNQQQPMAWLCLLSWERLRNLFCQQEYQLSIFSQLIETCEKISKLSTLKSFRQNGVTFPGFSVSCQDFVRPNRPRSRVIEAAPYAVCLALFGVSPLSKSSWGLLLTADRRRTLRTVGENIWKRTNRFKAMSQHSQDLYGTDTTFKQKTLLFKSLQFSFKTQKL